MVAVKVCAAGTRFLNNRNRNVEASGVILLSPLKKLIHRLMFILIGVFVMLLLSEMSKLNLESHLRAPRSIDYENGN